MGKRKQDLGDVPMGGTKDEESSDDVGAHPALQTTQLLTLRRTLT